MKTLYLIIAIVLVITLFKMVNKIDNQTIKRADLKMIFSQIYSENQKKLKEMNQLKLNAL